MRPRIRSAIDTALERPGAFVVMCANFGYGKTSALIEWAHSAESEGRRVAWLALDKYDNNASLFIGHLGSSLNEAFPQPVTAFEKCASPVTLNPIMAASTLLEDIERIECEVVLCLDDLQEISNDHVIDLVETLVTNASDRFHVIIASRKMPSFCTPSLLASGQAFLIGQDDLRFDENELSVFFNTALRDVPSRSQLNLTAKRSEGWPLAARLEVLSLNSAASTTHPPTNSLLRGSEPVSKTLFSGFLASMNEEVRNYLLVASLFENFCHSLVLHSNPEGFVIEGKDGPSLDKIVDDGIFITCLDVRGGEPWFRLHALFREELRRQAAIILPESERQLINRKAAMWLQHEGEFSLMMAHAMETKDPDFAASRLNIACLKVSHEAPKSPLFDIDRWMTTIPREALDKYPIIRIINALNQALADFDGCKPLIEATILSLPSEEELRSQQYGTEASGAAGLLKLVYAVASGQPNGEYAGQEIIDHVAKCFSDPDPMSARLHQMVSYLLLSRGDVSRAFNEIDHALRIAGSQPASLLYSHLLGNRIDLLLRTGQLEAAASCAKDMLAASPDQNWTLCANSLVTERARISLYQGYPQKAIEELTSLSGYLGRFGGLLRHETLTWAYIVSGQLEKAAMLQQSGLDGIRPLQTAALRCIEVFREGKSTSSNEPLATSIEYVPNWDMAVPGDLSFGPAVRHYSAVFTALGCLASGNPKSANQAYLFFKHAADAERKCSFLIPLVLSLTGKAWALFTMRDYPGAKKALKESLYLAGKTGRIDIFAMLPKKIDGMMRECAAEEALPIEVRSKMNRLQTSYRSAIGCTTNSQRTPDFAELILTSREVEILTLAAQGLTNKEIANKLVVSLNTVKSHLYNASQKLEARNRTEAVFYARSLGII